jgi:uncharacterized repeat protein (TIGR01451 family)
MAATLLHSSLRRFGLAIALCFHLFWLQGQSYWQEMPAPYGGAPGRMFATFSGDLYAEYADRSIYRSTDQGLTWQAVYTPAPDSDLTFQKVTTIGRYGTFFIEASGASTAGHDAYASFDQGLNWQVVQQDGPLYQFVESDNGDWFALRNGPDSTGGNLSQVVRSPDQGQSWETVFETTALLDQLRIDAFNRLIVLERIDSSWTVQVSTDQAESWHDLASLPTTSYDIDGSVHFVITPTNTLVHWREAYDMPFIWRIAAGSGQATAIAVPDADGIYPTHYLYDMAVGPAGELLLASSEALFISTNDGLDWQQIPQSPRAVRLPVGRTLPDGALLASGDLALLRTAAPFTDWTFSSTGVDQAFIQDLFVQPDGEWWAVTPSGLWRSADEGAQWSLLLAEPRVDKANLSNANGHFIAIDPLLRRYVLLGDSLFRTDDDVQFANVTPPAGFGPYGPYGIWVAPSTDHVFVDAATGTLRSTDHGATWQLIAPHWYMRNLERSPGGTLWAVRDTAQLPPTYPPYVRRLFYSEDEGLSWTQALDTQVVAFTVVPQGTIFAQGTNSRLYRSFDQGQSWQHRTRGTWIGRLAHNALGHLFQDDYAERLCRSIDGGLTWQLLPKPLVPPGDNFYNYEIQPDQRLYVLSRVSGSGAIYRTRNPTIQGATLTGQVTLDADGDCQTLEAGPALDHVTVHASGVDDWYATTDSLGRYTFFLDTGVYTIAVQPALGIFFQPCASPATVVVSSQPDTVVVDFRLLASSLCPYLHVDLVVPQLVRCFSSPVYVEACNLGTETADPAAVDVRLESQLSITGANWPYSDLGDNWYRFELGALAPGQCRTVVLDVLADCDSTVLGQTHCLEAHGTPDSICTPVAGWSGAELVAGARCTDDTLRFDVHNRGPVGSDMVKYIVVEDDVVLMQGMDAFGPGETRTYSWPANGEILRFESKQEPGHPFSQQIVALTTDCGSATPAPVLNQYVVDHGLPSFDRECIENIGSYDPNDKTGFPLGYGPQQLIEPGTELEYLIRFQNTGTAPAQRVVVRDTLSPWLDPASLRVGAASHAYTYTLEGPGVVSFVFDGIMLPDSNANEPASHGFVSFRVGQKPENALGTVIYNRAGIYFDFNDAVWTNTTVHRLGENFLTVAALEPNSARVDVRIVPNPTADVAEFRIAGLTGPRNRLQLSDARGNVVRRAVFDGPAYRFERRELPAGVYWFGIEDSRGRRIAAGRIAVF